MQPRKTFPFYNVYDSAKEGGTKKPRQPNSRTAQMLTSPRVTFPSVPCVRSELRSVLKRPFWDSPPLPSGLVHLTDLQGDGGPFRELRDPGELPAVVPCPTHCVGSQLKMQP